MKKILIPNTNLSEWALVNAAHRMGLYVITSGRNADGPAAKFSDEYCQGDYSDKEEMLELAKSKKIDYMCSNAHDFGTMSTAYVCEQLGLPGHDSYETTYTLHHKDTLKPLAKKLNLHMPVSEIFTDAQEAIDYIRSKECKVIIKPTDNASSVGVSVPESPEEIASSVKNAFENSKVKKIIVEPYIEGFYCTADAMIINQQVHAFVSDSNLIYPEGKVRGNRFPMNGRSNGAVRPSPYIKEFAPLIIDDFNKIAKELKLVDGAFHCELLVDKNHQPHIFDLHRRMSGFKVPWPNWNLTTGLRWEDWLLRAECGLGIDEFPKGLIQNRYLHTRNIYAPHNGIIKKMEFDEYLTSHIYPKFPGKRFAVYDKFISDYEYEPVINNMPPNVNGRMYFEFDTPEEANFIGSTEEDNFYSHVTFEFDI